METKNRFIKRFSYSTVRSWPLFLVVIIIFGVGVFFGAASVNNLSQEHISQLTGIIDKFLASTPDLHSVPVEIIKPALRDNLMAWGVLYFLGLTIIGIPMVLVLIFMRGFTLGFTISFLATQKSSIGTLLSITSILPHNLLLLPALFVSAVAAISFSILLLQRFFDTKVRVWPGFLGYSVVMILTGLLISFAAVIEAFVTPWLTRMASVIFTGGWSLPF